MRCERAIVRGALTALLVAGSVVASGCVASRRAAYARHLTATVQPGPAPTDDVAVAFGLDEYAAPVLAGR